MRDQDKTILTLSFEISFSDKFFTISFNPFQAVPLMEKSSAKWMIITSKMCEKHMWKSDIWSKDAGQFFHTFP